MSPQSEPSNMELYRKIQSMETRLERIESNQARDQIFQAQITTGRKVALWIFGALGSTALFILAFGEKLHKWFS